MTLIEIAPPLTQRIATTIKSQTNQLCISASGLTGLLVFSTPALWAHGLLLLIPVFWARTTNRLAASWVLAIFAAVMSRGLPMAAEVFYGAAYALWFGIAAGVLQCLLFFMMGMLCWHPDQGKRITRIPLLVLLWTLPPLGFVGWGNPLLAAGWLFPDWHWLGLVTLLLTMMLITWRIPFIVFPLLLLVINHNHPFSQAKGWQAHHTAYTFGTETQKRDLKAEYQRHRDMSTRIHRADSHTSVHLFPETVGGEWNPIASQYWQRQLQRADRQALNHSHYRPDHQTTVLIGASTRENGYRYNSVVAITAQQAKVAYHQRIPVPGVMWNPLRDKAYSSSLGLDQPSVITINDKRTAFLICYEALLTLPLLQSMLDQPQHLAVLSSVWWAPDYMINAQRAATHSWARLFGLSLSKAYNQ